MRIKVGLATVVMTAASVLTFGLPTEAQTDDTTTTVADSAPDTTSPEAPDSGEPAPDTTPDTTDDTAPDERSTTTSSSSTTTTTAPGAVSGGATVGAGAAVPASLPQRGESQVVLIPPPPNTFGLPANSGTGRRVVYSKSQQQVWVVNSDGIVIKNHLVSGKLRWCDPRTGTYQVFSRSRYTSALQDPAIIWGYMVRFAHGCNGGNIGFHEIPTNTRTGNKMQSVSQLGTPLSGGCVRQSVPDAIWMWNWAYIGTKVVVLA